MKLLDTQAVIWLRTGHANLGPRTLEFVRQSWRDGEAAVSAITFWEMAMLHSKSRVALPIDTPMLREELLDDGLIEIPVDGEIGMRAGLLPDFHGDPADRIIVATALAGHTLVTSDRQIQNWTGPLERVDARR